MAGLIRLRPRAPSTLQALPCTRPQRPTLRRGGARRATHSAALPKPVGRDRPNVAHAKPTSNAGGSDPDVFSCCPVLGDARDAKLTVTHPPAQQRRLPLPTPLLPATRVRSRESEILTNVACSLRYYQSNSSPQLEHFCLTIQRNTSGPGLPLIPGGLTFLPQRGHRMRPARRNATPISTNGASLRLAHWIGMTRSSTANSGNMLASIRNAISDFAFGADHFQEPHHVFIKPINLTA